MENGFQKLGTIYGPAGLYSMRDARSNNTNSHLKGIL